MLSSWLIFYHPKTNKVLIIKRSQQVRNPGQWCFPGGSTNKDIKARKLAKKEAREEVGIKLKDISLVLKTNTRNKLYYFYIYYINPPKKRLNIIINHESDNYKWVSLGKLKKLKNSHKSIKLFLKRYGKEQQTKTNIRSIKATN